jgi:hypothetical protein
VEEEEHDDDDDDDDDEGCIGEEEAHADHANEEVDEDLLYKAHRVLYVVPASTPNSAFGPQSLFICSLWFSEQTTIISKSSVLWDVTTRRYIPEDRTLHNRRCENLGSSRPLFP